MPDCLQALAAEAIAAGVMNVGALMTEWAAGTLRFDGDGEQLLLAVADGERVIGVGGLTVCPDVVGALRVRRFYVASDWRRRGVGAEIARRLVVHGLAHADMLSCNAQASDAAPQFWESLGFERTDRAGVTHVLVRS